jgi:uncharacterized protein (TIGR02265 family)
MMTYEFNTETAMPVLMKLGLKERLARATQSDTVRGIFFNGALDTLRTFADDELLRRSFLMLRQSKFFDFFSYSIFDFLRLAFMTAQCMSNRQGGFDTSLRRLGQRGMTDFLESMAGKTFLTFSGTDARRLLTNLPVLFRTAVSYGERTVEWRGPRSCRILMKRDFMPPVYHEGAIKAAMEALRPQFVSILSAPTGPLDSEYLVSWE